MRRYRRFGVGLVIAFLASGCDDPTPGWELANPILPLPEPPLGIEQRLTELEDPPTPERVRLGRWLFFDPRLSADGKISCASCHRPENAFSEPTPVSTGIGGQMGGRKAPSFVNQAWTIYPHFFWDGRSSSLEDQALGPIQNPIEMGNSLTAMLATLERGSYAPYFEQAFGDDEITADRVAKAIAAYERTRLSGNSPWDRWQAGDENAVSDLVKRGHDLFFGRAGCNQCHLGQNFTDSRFHTLGIGWDAEDGAFTDEGRFAVNGEERDLGAFKTPGLRDVTRHAPYMHDGSIATLREVIELYNAGGIHNPFLSPRIRPLGLDPEEVDALEAFLRALDGVGYQDRAPSAFPGLGPHEVDTSSAETVGG
ncbi:MAG: cytochrome-c peroxidase [Gemmatimonadota bacterium]